MFNKIENIVFSYLWNKRREKLNNALKEEAMFYYTPAEISKARLILHRYSSARLRQEIDITLLGSSVEFISFLLKIGAGR